MSTLVLDVDETLSDLGPVGEVLERHGLPAELARTWFTSELRDGFALSVHRQAPGFLALGEQVLLQLLAADGHRLVTFTDGGVAGAAALLERAGVRDVVDQVLSVEGSPVWKPHPDTYALTVRAWPGAFTAPDVVVDSVSGLAAAFRAASG